MCRHAFIGRCFFLAILSARSLRKTADHATGGGMPPQEPPRNTSPRIRKSKKTIRADRTLSLRLDLTAANSIKKISNTLLTYEYSRARI